MVEPKYLQLVHVLRKRIAESPSDACLPPERLLAEEYAVSRVTIRAAMRALAELGLVASHQGRGTFIVRGQGSSTPVATPLVHLVLTQVPISEDFFLARLVDRITERVSAQGWRLQLSRVGAGEPLASRILESGSLDSLRAGGVIVIYEPDDRASLEKLRQADIPVVLIGDTETGYPFPRICGEQISSAAAALRHLHAHGHRRIAIVDGPDSLPYVRRRREMLESTIAELGMDDPAWIPGVGWECSSGRSAAAAILALATRPSAIINWGDHSTVGLVTELLARGIRIPEDLAIVAIDHLPLANRILPIAMSGWSGPVESFVNQAFELHAAQRRGEPLTSTQTVIPSVFTRGTSCGCTVRR